MLPKWAETEILKFFTGTIFPPREPFWGSGCVWALNENLVTLQRRTTHQNNACHFDTLCDLTKWTNFSANFFMQVISRQSCKNFWTIWQQRKLYLWNPHAKNGTFLCFSLSIFPAFFEHENCICWKRQPYILCLRCKRHLLWHFSYVSVNLLEEKHWNCMYPKFWPGNCATHLWQSGASKFFGVLQIFHCNNVAMKFSKKFLNQIPRTTMSFFSYS